MVAINSQADHCDVTCAHMLEWLAPATMTDHAQSLDLGLDEPSPLSVVNHGAFRGLMSASRDWFLRAIGEPTPFQADAWSQPTDRLLLSAPTGYGKTLAAMFRLIDALYQRRIQGAEQDGVHVLYITPLRALSHDIAHNLVAPARGIFEQISQVTDHDPLTIGARTGDTPQSERAKQRRHPPDILVTTPESVYILLASASGRAMLSTVAHVVVDELHALCGDKRGAHLALSLSRLRRLTSAPPTLTGLGATVSPVHTAWKLLEPAHEPDVVRANVSKQWAMDIVMPPGELGAVISGEQMGQCHQIIATLSERHRTTLVFTLTRRAAESTARALSALLGDESVAAHHGSLSRDVRLEAERRLRSGDARVVVATASLELGIDIGHVDLVVQLGTSRSFNSVWQRLGRSGRGPLLPSKGVLIPTTLTQLEEAIALRRGLQHGQLDAIAATRPHMDVLAQHVVAEAASADCSFDDILAICQDSGPYRDISAADVEQCLSMLHQGYMTSRGRRGALVRIQNGVVTGRPGSALRALTNGSTIRETYDYDVLCDDTSIGSITEDFALESMPGDVLQLGNTPYRIEKVNATAVHVTHAPDANAVLPFWLGESPGRTAELTQAISDMRRTWLAADASQRQETLQQYGSLTSDESSTLHEYYLGTYQTLGNLPTLSCIIAERFFDRAGDQHLVIHFPAGARVNRAFALALRKRFCRQYNFELQATAIDDCLLLSLGPTHSFSPVHEPVSYLTSKTARGVLEQALLDSPLFQMRWRHVATTSLAVARNIHGKRRPGIWQRVEAEDLLAQVFPDQLACLENIRGEREIPDHVLVKQALDDSLEGTLDASGLIAAIRRIEQGEIDVTGCDSSEHSPMAESVITARPYAYIDDGELEDRRTRNIPRRRSATDEPAARVDTALIRQARVLAAPAITDMESLRDAIDSYAWVWVSDIAPMRPSDVAHEAPDLIVTDDRITSPTHHEMYQRAQDGDNDALHATLRLRLDVLSPATIKECAQDCGLPEGRVAASLLHMQSQGQVFQHVVDNTTYWMPRWQLQRLLQLARTQERRWFDPVSCEVFTSALCAWHRISVEPQAAPETVTLDHVLSAMQPLHLWPVSLSDLETHLLPARCPHASTLHVEAMCASGEIRWRMLSPRHPRKTITPASHLSFMDSAQWRACQRVFPPPPIDDLGREAKAIYVALDGQQAGYLDDIVTASHALPAQIQAGTTELVACSAAVVDGLRLFRPSLSRRSSARNRRPRRSLSGRIFMVSPAPQSATSAQDFQRAREQVVKAALTHFGVLAWPLVRAHPLLGSWRDVRSICRQLELAGEVRVGRFVQHLSGEQFALTGFVSQLEDQAQRPPSDLSISLSPSDPISVAKNIVQSFRP